MISGIIIISCKTSQAQSWTTSGDTISSTGNVKAANLDVTGTIVKMPGLVADTTTDLLGISKLGSVTALKGVALNNVLFPPVGPGYLSIPCISNLANWLTQSSAVGSAAYVTTTCTWVGIGEAGMAGFPDAPLSVSNNNSTNQFTIVNPTSKSDVFTVDYSGNTSLAGLATVGNRLNVSTTNAAGQTATFLNGSLAALFFTTKTQVGDFNGLSKANDNGIFWADDYGTGNVHSGLVIAPWVHSSGGIRIDSVGNVTINSKVGILTTPSSYPLDVNGIIRANEVKVCVFGTCDFVFDKDYKLMPINELENYLQLNHHLPGIPSAEEMQSGDGVALGKMNSQLLQKVEELTLYIIQQDKKLDELEKKVNALSDNNK